MSGEQQDVLDAVKAGASGYLLKSAAREEFLEAVRRTARGRAVFVTQLFISHRTVQNHVQNTLSKLQMHNRVELVRYAIGQGLDRG